MYLSYYACLTIAYIKPYAITLIYWKVKAQNTSYKLLSMMLLVATRTELFDYK